MRKYWTIFKINWQKSVEYRVNFLAHLGMGLISFWVMYFIWSAVFKNQPNFGGFTFSTMMTYVLMTKFLHFTNRGNIAREIGQESKDGSFSFYMVKPISYLRWWFSAFLAERAFEFIIRLLMITVFLSYFPK